MRRAIYPQITFILNKRENQLRWLLKVRWLIVFGRLKYNVQLNCASNQHNRRKEYYISIGSVRYGFQVTVSWLLWNLFEVSSLSFHAGIAGDRLLGPYFLPQRLIGAVYHDGLRNVFPDLFEGVDLQTRIYWWFIFFLHYRNFWETCFQMGWGTNSMSCPFPWFKSLISLSQGTSEVCCLC
jgi:hypothetical protein